MGRKNDVVLEYLKDTARFADLYNGGCFGGEQVVLAEKVSCWKIIPCPGVI